MSSVLASVPGQDAAIVNQSSFQAPVVWKGKAALKGLPERFKVKVTFEGSRKADIRFSALYVVPDDAK